MEALYEAIARQQLELEHALATREGAWAERADRASESIKEYQAELADRLGHTAFHDSRVSWFWMVVAVGACLAFPPAAPFAFAWYVYRFYSRQRAAQHLQLVTMRAEERIAHYRTEIKARVEAQSRV
jgi:hypothetical protein